MAAIFKREVRSYYTGMVGYVTAAVTLFFLGLYFTNRNLMGASSDFATVLYTTTLIMLFLIPAISMRSFAEERRAKTDQLLLTSPVTVPGIVLGKFLAEWAAFALPTGVAVFMPLILTAFGRVSLVSSYSALLVYLLLAGACLAIGTLVSALTENQIIAYLVTFGILIIAYLMNSIQTMFTSGNLLALTVFLVVLIIAAVLIGVLCKSLVVATVIVAIGAAALFVLFSMRPTWLLLGFDKILGAMALFEPFNEVVGGMLGLSTVVYYVSVIAFFLLLTGQALERRRWA